MNRTIFTLVPALAVLTSVALAGCGSLNVWPFGAEKLVERSRVPADATEYRCTDGKRFHVRTLDGGSAAWLILPDREVRLDKTAAATRFSNGITTLDVDAGNVTLADRTTTLTGCKAVAGGK